MKESQHCILFSSEQTSSIIFGQTQQTMRLSVNLRSTVEIINYIERYRNHEPCLKLEEFRCLTAHNFHGEKPDIRPCDSIRNFIQESLRLIEEYLQKSRGLEYLPVVLRMPEETKQQLRSRLKERNIQFDYYIWGCLHVETACIADESLPCVRLFNSLEIDGLEFAVTIALLSDTNLNGFELPRQFYNIITRACTKLIIVHRSNNKSELTKKSEKQSKLTNSLLMELERAFFDSQKIVILVGTNYQFQFLTKASESELHQRNVCLPNIEGLKYFKGPNDISIVQIDDIYKKQELQELIKAGLRKVIIVGSEHTGPF